MFIDATVQFPQLNPTTQVSDFGIQLLKQNLSNVALAIFMNSAHYACLQRDSHVKCLLSDSAKPLKSSSSNLDTDRITKSQKRKKKGPKTENPRIQYARVAKAHNQEVDASFNLLSVQSSLIWLVPVYFRHEKVLEHARQNCVCARVWSP